MNRFAPLRCRADRSTCLTSHDRCIAALCGCKLDNLGKRWRVAHCQFCKNLPVDFEILAFQRGGEFRICRSVHSRCSIDASNPELAERAFLCLAVSISKLHPFVNMMLCYCIDLASRAPITFRLLHDALATAMGGNLTACTAPLCGGVRAHRGRSVRAVRSRDDKGRICT